MHKKMYVSIFLIALQITSSIVLILLLSYSVSLPFMVVTLKSINIIIVATFRIIHQLLKSFTQQFPVTFLLIKTTAQLTSWLLNRKRQPAGMYFDVKTHPVTARIRCNLGYHLFMP